MDLRYVKQCILILLIEVLIAFWGIANIYRLYLGYILMVPLIYSFIKIFVRNKKTLIILIVLIFLLFIEFQRDVYIDLKLLSEYRVLKSLPKDNYDMVEIICYILGGLYCYGIEVKDLGYKFYFFVSVASSLGITYYFYKNSENLGWYDYSFYFFIFIRILAYFNILNLLYIFIVFITNFFKLNSKSPKKIY